MSKKFIALLLGAFVLMGGFFLWTLYGGLSLPGPAPAPSTASAPPAPPPPPSVAFTVKTSHSGNSFVVAWHNLPANTVALNILRKPKASAEPWKLWKQISISANDRAGGQASFDIGSYTFTSYSFSVETVGNLTDSSGNTTGQEISWTSSSTTVTVTTSSTTSTTNTSQTSTTTTATTTATTTSATTTATTTTSETPTTTATTTPTPSGTPYYNPQIQLSGYGAEQAGSFWVQYVDQKIQIGWQNLPTSTTAISVLRSTSAGGPWATILTQSDIDPTGPSTIQIVDDTLNQTSYYELDAKTGGTSIAIYGPVSLPPISQ